VIKVEEIKNMERIAYENSDIAKREESSASDIKLLAKLTIKRAKAREMLAENEVELLKIRERLAEKTKKLIERISKLPDFKPKYYDKIVEELKLMDKEQQIEFIEFLEKHA